MRVFDVIKLESAVFDVIRLDRKVQCNASNKKRCKSKNKKQNKLRSVKEVSNKFFLKSNLFYL